MTDYKKLYEEALERAKEMSALPDDRATMEYIFPELKESEDDKMLNQLHEWMKEFGGAEEYTEKVYCWLKGLLEKQGEKLPVGFYYVDSNGNKYFSDTFKNGDFTFHVEKGEQIHANFAKTCKDEQKNADKVEPKREPKKASCNDYMKIIEHYGVRNQLKKLSEEVFELQEAVIEEDIMCGVNGIHTEHICEEIADVFVLLFQLQEFYGISKYEISDMICYKVERTLERIKKEVKNENEQ